MAEGPDGKNIIIVKKVSGHGGHHGGAWKVAFADFITAMMALFMVLWLVNTASVTTRERIANYFRQPGVFEKGSGTPLEIGGAGIMSDAFSPPTEGNSEIAIGFTKQVYKVEKYGGLTNSVNEGTLGKEGKDAKGGGPTTGVGSSQIKDNKEQIYEEKIELDKIAASIKGLLGQQPKSDGLEITASPQQLAKLVQMQKYLGNVEIKVDQRGLHLEIMDTATASMFEVGSNTINLAAEQELIKIGAILAKLPNPIDIEGHTDSSPFSDRMKDSYDNWNLSTDRANAARRVLLKAGVQEKQIARVVGYADKRPKDFVNGLAPSNRRISVSMRYTEHAASALENSKTKVTEPKLLPEFAKPNAEKEKKEEHVPPVQTEEKILSTSKIKAATPKSGLNVEVETRMPEGDLIVEQKKESNSSDWKEKDKIFGNQDPFFAK